VDRAISGATVSPIVFAEVFVVDAINMAGVAKANGHNLYLQTGSDLQYIVVHQDL
jgi:hypothetical protein